MADIRKFLDQGGVSTLWSAIAEEVAKVDDKAAKNAEDIVELKGKVEALEKGTYDDTEVRGLITANAAEIAKNKAAHEANAGAIAVLNGGAEDAGSVVNTANAAAAAKVAEIVAGADAKFDTLKEIADWILTDTTGAAGMAADIDALEAKMAGVEETVVKSIAAAIEEALKVDGADKFALASELTALANRVKAIEDAGYQNADQVSAAINAAITALKLGESFDAKGAAATAEANAKAYADGLAGNYDAAGTGAAAAAQAEANAKAYTDTEVAKIQALTTAEIQAAIAAAKAQA
jgi:hypothetical protein